MTDIDLDAIRARADAARQAAASGTTGLPPNIDGLSISEALDIFAESAADVPALLYEVVRLRAERDTWHERWLQLMDHYVEVAGGRDRAESTIARVRELADDGMRHFYVEQTDENGILLSVLNTALTEEMK